MNKIPGSLPPPSRPRVILSLAFFSIAGFLAVQSLIPSPAQAASPTEATGQTSPAIQFGVSYHNDVSPPLRDLPAIWPPKPSNDHESEESREARANPKLPL